MTTTEETDMRILLSGVVGSPPVPYEYSERTPPPVRSGHMGQDEFGKIRRWRPSRSAQPCLRWVAGKRCLLGHERDCPGCPVGWSSLLDHVRMWLTGGGGRVLICEPYDMGSERQQAALAKLAEAAAGQARNADALENQGVAWAPVANLDRFIPRGDVFPPILRALEESRDPADD